MSIYDICKGNSLCVTSNADHTKVNRLAAFHGPFNAVTNAQAEHGGTGWRKDGYLVGGIAYFVRRSEEHTSELQSRPHLVCRLLLEKKNTRNRGSNCSWSGNFSTTYCT